MIKPGSYLVIEGNIGAGKTSLAKMMAHQFNTGLILESFADNTFLPRFYEDRQRYAFPLEMSFMAERYRQLTDAFRHQPFQRPVISDYFFGKCLLFAGINLSEPELDVFRQFFDLLQSRIPHPHLIVLLNKNVDLLQENIKKRGRDFEKNISRQYLQHIHAAYENWYQQLNKSKIPVLRIDTDELDFVNNPHHYSQLVNTIISHLKR
jgi:deoxyadenosine/deoxycytidine kinase